MSRGGTGVVLAVVSAATFGTSGSFATSLIQAGWTPAAAVTARISVAAVLLTVPAVIQLRREWPALRAAGAPALPQSALMVGVYGLIAVAGCQIFFFNAVQRLSVGVALLLEYLGIILVVLWVWLRHDQRPRRLTVAGSFGAMVGLVFVLHVTGGQHLDGVGVLWGLGAAIGLAVYFVLSSRAQEPLPPLVMAWAAMTVGALCLVVMGTIGALPMNAGFADVRFAGHRMSWIVPIAGLSLVAAAFAYVAGIGAARLLGAKLASFLGLTEVLFAVLFAWMLLGQLPAGTQLVGGALVLAGVTLVRIDELRIDRAHSAVLLAEPLPVS
ncbi:MAG: DMT family transporter [Actinomycetota bacterium]|nr:DMT family transporter [Actinomycetota bacterium]